MTHIPFADLHRQYLEIKDEVLIEIEKVLMASAFTNGYSVNNFEVAFAEYCKTKFSAAVNSGTSALHLALSALDINKNDEVIVPANTFIATAWGVAYRGAVPVFVDCDAFNWEIDPSKIEKKITGKTKAIIGVHLYGQAFDIDSIAVLAKEHNFHLVEDACQAHGATYKGRMTGSMGNIGCFSFYPGKNLGTYGEGGAITTNDESIINRIKALRNHGSLIRYYHDDIGFNMRMGGLEGAVLNVKLKYLDRWNEKRKKIAQQYKSSIKNTKIKFQQVPDYTEPVYHLFVIAVEDREAFVNHLNKYDISPGFHYPVPCHLQKAFASLDYKKGDLPNSEYLADHCVSLPMFPELTDEEVLRVIDAVNGY